VANEEANRETVSIEAHDRAKNDLTKLETENTKLQTRIEELSNTVVDSKKMELARDWLMGQGVVADAYSDANQKATFVLPHLREVEVDKIGETLNQDEFKFLTSVPSTDTTSSGEPKEEVAVEQPTGGFTGPNPSGSEKPPDPSGKIAKDSPEYQAVVQANDWKTMSEWFENDRIADPIKPY